MDKNSSLFHCMQTRETDPYTISFTFRYKTDIYDPHKVSFYCAIFFSFAIDFPAFTLNTIAFPHMLDSFASPLPFPAISVMLLVEIAKLQMHENTICSLLQATNMLINRAVYQF